MRISHYRLSANQPCASSLKPMRRENFILILLNAGSREIVIQPLSDQITDYYVELKNPFTPAIKKYYPGSFIPDTSKLSDINNVIISSQINNIYEPYTPAAGKNTADQVKAKFLWKTG